jgi:hypothetical protein
VDEALPPKRDANSGDQRQKYYAAFDFIDEAADERYYDYVAADEEPIRTLHSAMNSKDEPGSAVFFVCSDIR